MKSRQAARRVSGATAKWSSDSCGMVMVTSSRPMLGPYHHQERTGTSRDSPRQREEHDAMTTAGPEHNCADCCADCCAEYHAHPALVERESH